MNLSTSCVSSIRFFQKTFLRWLLDFPCAVCFLVVICTVWRAPTMIKVRDAQPCLVFRFAFFVFSVSSWTVQVRDIFSCQKATSRTVSLPPPCVCVCVCGFISTLLCLIAPFRFLRGSLGNTSERFVRVFIRLTNCAQCLPLSPFSVLIANSSLPGQDDRHRAGIR